MVTLGENKKEGRKEVGEGGMEAGRKEIKGQQHMKVFYLY